METVFESAQNAEGPAVSVVVVSYNTPRTLEKCLAALARQPAAEILVIDCSDRDPGQSLRSRFPGVVFHHFPSKLSLPELRRDGIRASTGEIVALTESWMRPSPGWVAALREAHRQSTDAAAVGGPVAFPCEGKTASLLAWADYFCEYGEYVPGSGNSTGLSLSKNISGANCSYKRWALEECRDLIEQAAWEPRIHERLRQRGHGLMRVATAWVCYDKSCRLRDLLSQRFHYGRGHAAERLRRAPWIGRLARGAAAPLVPWVLLGRLWRIVRPIPGVRTRFLAATGWILALNSAWALGEAAGAWFGPAGGDPDIF